MGRPEVVSRLLEAGADTANVGHGFTEKKEAQTAWELAQDMERRQRRPTCQLSAPDPKRRLDSREVLWLLQKYEAPAG